MRVLYPHSLPNRMLSGFLFFVGVILYFDFVCIRVYVCAHVRAHSCVFETFVSVSILRARGLQIGGQKRVRWPKLKPITLFSTYPFKSMWSQIWIFSIFHQALNLNNVYIYFSLKIWPLAVQYIPSGEI